MQSVSFAEKNSRTKKVHRFKKILNHKAMNFSIFLWYMKKFNIFTASCIFPLSLSSTYSFYNVNPSKHEKCENRFQNNSECKKHSLLCCFMKKKFHIIYFLIPLAFSFAIFMRQCTQKTHTNPALRACNSFTKGK